MKITAVETILLTGPCTNDRFLREARGLRSAAFIRIHTDTEQTGLGETYAGYFCPEIVPSIVEFFEPILVGQKVDESDDPAAWIDAMWQRMFHCGNFWCRVGLGAIVLTGIEAALWDLAGRMRGKPVVDLLGGAKHASLKCYATGGPSNYPKSRLAEKADYYLGLDFRGFKVGAGTIEQGKWSDGSERTGDVVSFEADKIAFLRNHCGKDVHILMDAHMGNSPTGVWDVPTAIAVAKAVEPYDLFLLEEALPYTDAAGYAELAAATRTPIAGGECLSTVSEWLEYLSRDSFDIAQPDASYVGGLGEFMKIARMLEARDRNLATHAWGAGGSLMQNIHCGFAAANTCMLEIPPDYAGLHSEVIGDALVMRDGVILPPVKPGLGIELRDTTRANYPFIPGSGEFNEVPGKVLMN